MPEEEVPRGKMPEGGWGSVVRVAREGTISAVSIGTVVVAGAEWGVWPQNVMETHPSTFMLVAAYLPTAVRWLIKVFGKQKKGK